jgi:enoyl-CoA hydratase
MPTIAAVSGHAIAGGAMLTFACDLRYLADGPFRLHLNETAIGLPLPTWALMLGQSAVPKRWHTEAMLLARAYTPAEALARDIVDAVVPPEQLLETALAAAAPLTALDRAAFATSKARHRAMAVQWAEARIEPELVGPAPGAQR